MVRIVYKHWKNGKTLEITGVLPKALNNTASDRFIVQLEDGTFEDVLKNTVVNMHTVEDT